MGKVDKMRWFFSIIKIGITIFVIALVIKFTMVYMPGFSPLNLVPDWIRGSKSEGVTPLYDNSQNINGIKDGCLNEDSSESENQQLNGRGNSGEICDFPYQSLDDDQGGLSSYGSKEDEASPKKPNEYYMTLAELLSFSNISFLDKLECLSVAGKLKKADTDKLLAIANGGITMDELKEIRSILKKRLTDKEIGKLDDILAKNRRLYAEGKLEK